MVSALPALWQLRESFLSCVWREGRRAPSVRAVTSEASVPSREENRAEGLPDPIRNLTSQPLPRVSSSHDTTWQKELPSHGATTLQYLPFPLSPEGLSLVTKSV